MERNLININIVLVARNHNPAIPTKDWLLDKKIFDEEPLSFVNTPVFSLFDSNKFNFSVDENRLQLSSKQPNPNILDDLATRIIRYVEILSETPYISLGMNFGWEYKPSDGKENLVDLIQDKFVKNADEYKKFSEQTRFGFTVIFPFNSIRVTARLASHVTENQFRIDFNFHRESLESPNKTIGVEDIKDTLKNIKGFFNKAEEVRKFLIGD